MLLRVALLLLILLIAGLAWAGLMIGLIAHAILHPPRMSDARALVRLRRLSPEDLGIGFEDANFEVRDEHGPQRLKIAGWWMPAKPVATRTAILLHGYADAKVGAIAWAAPLLACGLNVLAIDLRAHGDSGGSHCTAGFFEKSDLSQVIDQVRLAHPHETQQVVLFGASMGAAVAAAVATERDDMAAVVLDSPYADFRAALAVRAAQRGLPTGMLLAAASWVAERWSGARFDTVRPVELVNQVRCPMLVVLPGADALIDDAGRDQIVHAVSGNNEVDSNAPAGPPLKGDALLRRVYAPAGVGHLMAFSADPDQYTQQLQQFLTAALAVPETVQL